MDAALWKDFLKQQRDEVKCRKERLFQAHQIFQLRAVLKFFSDVFPVAYMGWITERGKKKKEKEKENVWMCSI